MAQYFYDRVAILVDGIPYLPLGTIRNFSMQVTYNTRIQPSQTPNGVSAGLTIGNKSISFNWTEFLPIQSEYINWRTFTIANPNTVLTVIPITLATGVPTAPSFTLTGIGVTGASVSAPNEGEVMTRDNSFVALDSSNT